MPLEGRQAGIPHAGELARADAPTCRLGDRVGDARDRVQASGWDMCVVVNDQDVVMGVLSMEAMISDPNAAAEQLMEPGPTTIRPSWLFEQTSEYLKKRSLDRILVTTSGGRLVGVYVQADAARRMKDFRASEHAERGDQKSGVAEAKKPRVLYADESRDNCDFIVRDLVDYEVACATTAVDALREGKSGGFDLILLDDRLPGATGIEICQELRAYDHLTPIMILSGPDNETARGKAFEAGAQDYWPAPVDIEAVGREIKRLIELKRAASSEVKNFDRFSREQPDAEKKEPRSKAAKKK